MKQLIRNLLIITLIFILVFIGLFAGLIYQQKRSLELLQGKNQENKLALAEIYRKAGSIYDRNFAILAESSSEGRQYCQDPLVAAALVQTIGDYSHNIRNTIEEAYQPELCATNRGFFKQIIYDFTGRGLKGSDLRLALDSKLVRKAAELLQGYRASLVLLNYRTGEVLALANTPLISVEDVIEWRNIKEGSLFNKALQAGYAPGSTFKIITDLAWLSSPQYQEDLLITCLGQEPLLGPGSVLENRSDAGHGTLGRREALAKSCNHFFGAVGVKVGAEQLLSTAKNFGFAANYSLDRLKVKPSEISLLAQMDDFVLSWLAIGQAIEGCKLTVTPLQLAMMSAGVAANGKIYAPKLVLDLREGHKLREDFSTPQVLFEVADARFMHILKEDMVYAVETGMASSAQIPEQEVGGKTGTAEFQTSDGSLKANALFTGFLHNEHCPLALGMVIEGENPDISKLAGEIFRYALDNYHYLP